MSTIPSAPTTQTELDALHHIALQVSDINRAVNWYRNQFQVEVVYQDNSWAMLRFANIKLALVVPNQHPPHIAIARDNAADFGTLQLHRDGTRSVYINDSEGNSIEVLDQISLHDH